jgi:RNA polymerase sigma-70 factor (ECF subfamily)
MLSSNSDRLMPAGSRSEGTLSPNGQQWLADLYEAHFAAVFRVCSRVLRNPEDAADAAQEVFLTAVRSLEAGASKRQARAWLMTVARNHCLDSLRRRKRLGTALVALGSEPEAGRDIEGDVADRQFVDRVIRELPLRERQALWESAVESRPVADIARHLQLSYMAAAQVLHRARRHAAMVAARVAVVVVGLFGLSRQRTANAASNVQRLVATAALPIAAVAVISQSSSGSSASAGSPVPTVLTQTAAGAATSGSRSPSASSGNSQNAIPGGMGGLVLPRPSSLPGTVVLPTALPSALPLPSGAALPSIPAVPSAIATPSVPPLPSLPALPSPSPTIP